jgi:hypothetical protein
MPFAIAYLTTALRTAALVGLVIGGIAVSHPAAAAGFRQGAYADSLGSTAVVCVTAQHMANLTAPAWKNAMQQRGMDCTLSDSDRPMPGHETWKARCTAPAQGASASPAHLYQFTVHADGEQLVIDSGMQTSAGRQMMKKAFFGTYQGACAPATPPLDVWAYLDGTHGMGSPAQADASRAVAIDLIRCSNVFNGLSLSVAKARQEAMRAAAAAMLEAAVELHPGEGDFHIDALKKSAHEVSAELVGASAEKRFALYQSCSPYLENDGIAKAVQSRVAAGATPR